MHAIGERIKQNKEKKRKELKLSNVKSMPSISIGNLNEIENNKYMSSAQTIIELSKISV